MRASLSALSAASVAALIVGCGGSSSTPPATVSAGTASATGGQAASSTIGAAALPAAVPTNPIAKVVHGFLDAVRRGDAQAAGEFMTPLALARTSESDYVFTPPGSATARFQVGASAIMGEGEAVVESVWSDVDADGKLQHEPIVWALKQTDGAWRISGMIADMGEGVEPLTVDFENPETMVPQKPIEPSKVVDSTTSPPMGQPSGAVARNPFDQASQR